MAESCMKQVRIYIGGLGATVTANDLTKTFSAPSLGTVNEVELIRTKERSFAYLDFVPCSDKGLAKLFSTYNGCKWKGGSLRLEKAKEHYLQQMRREWEEDTELATNSLKEDGDSAEKALHTVKSKKVPDLDKMQLKIFFPRLGKVKAVPFKGTGKHKYSFQRIEALPMPKYFCDCEEHSGAQDVDKGHQHDIEVKDDFCDENEKENEKEIENGEVKEQELTMMNSVMSKLFERELFSEATRKCGSSAVTLKNVTAIGDLPSTEDHPDQMSDEDNLIINIVGGSKNMGPSNQDLCLKELRNSKGRPQNLHTSKQKMTVPVGEKRKLLKDDKTRIVSDVPGRKIRKILPSNKDGKANLSHSKGTRTSDLIVSKKCPDGFEGSAEPQTNASETTRHKPGQLQKPAQRGLSAEVDNSTFVVSSSAPSGSPGADFQSGSDVLNKPHTAEKDENNSSLEIKEAKVFAEDSPGRGKINPPTAEKVENNSSLQIKEAKVFSEDSPGGGKINPHTAEKVENNSSLQIKDSEVSAEILSGREKVIADKASRGASWLQKSSWTQLVGGSNSGSFSISHILPQMNFDKQEIHQPAVIDFSSQKQTSHVPAPREFSKTVMIGAHDANQIDGQINEACTSSASNTQPLAAKKASTDEDETFAFYRTAASMKEYTQLRASLSGSLKKKGDKR